MTLPENVDHRRTGGGHGNPWPEEKRLEVAQLLARGHSAADAGRKVDVPESTIRTWRAEAEFAATVERLRAELLEETTAALVGVGRLAVDTLAEGMRGEATAVQVRSAQAALSLVLPLREAVFLEERIVALEAAHAERTS